MMLWMSFMRIDFEGDLMLSIIFVWTAQKPVKTEHDTKVGSAQARHIVTWTTREMWVKMQIEDRRINDTNPPAKTDSQDPQFDI